MWACLLETLTKVNVSVDILVSRLQSVNDAYDGIVDSLEEIVDFVNSEGGWNVYGWGERYFINDVSLLGNDIKEPDYNKVLSQKISNRVVHLHPSKKDYLGLSTICGGSLENLKFYFSTL